MVSGGFMEDKCKINLGFCGFEEEEEGRVCFKRREKQSTGLNAPFFNFQGSRRAT